MFSYIVMSYAVWQAMKKDRCVRRLQQKEYITLICLKTLEDGEAGGNVGRGWRWGGREVGSLEDGEAGGFPGGWGGRGMRRVWRRRGPREQRLYGGGGGRQSQKNARMGF